MSKRPSPSVRSRPSSGNGDRRGRPTAVDLFAGAGGLALGFEQAGFDVLATVEYDPVHAAVHAYNFPQAKVLCADVEHVTREDMLSAVQEGWQNHGYEGAFDDKIDVIFGGPPCQGFSTIGKRLVDDGRNRLVFHFFRLITELRPRYFVMENVPGMTLGGHSGILQRLIEEFQRVGYAVTLPPQILNAADFGVPQDRRRLFLLGSARGERPVTYPLPTVRPVARRGNGWAAGEQLVLDTNVVLGPTVSDALGDLPDPDSFEELALTDAVRLSASQAKEIERRASQYVRRLRDSRLDPEDLSHPRRWDRQTLTCSMRTEHTELSVTRFTGTIPGDVEPISRFYRLPADGLCNTLRAGTGSERGAYTSPRPIHPSLPRVISVREAARLHSFPDWFRLHQTKWHGFRQVGNAVPPLLGRAVAHRIVVALDLEPRKPRKAIPLGDPKLLAFSMSEAAEYFGAKPEHIPKPRMRRAITDAEAR